MRKWYAVFEDARQDKKVVEEGERDVGMLKRFDAAAKTMELGGRKVIGMWVEDTSTEKATCPEPAAVARQKSDSAMKRGNSIPRQGRGPGPRPRRSEHGLVDRIVLRPREDGFKVELVGEIARTVEVALAKDNKKSHPRRDGGWFGKGGCGGTQPPYRVLRCAAFNLTKSKR